MDPSRCTANPPAILLNKDHKCEVNGDTPKCPEATVQAIHCVEVLADMVLDRFEVEEKNAANKRPDCRAFKVLRTLERIKKNS